MSDRRRRSMVGELRLALARALAAVADGTRGRRLNSTIERDVAELRVRVEDLEDNLAAFGSRVERDEETLRPWAEVRR